MIALWVGLPRNFGSVPSIGKKAFPCPQRPYQFRDPASLLFSGYRERFSRSKAPLPQMPSWIAQLQLTCSYFPEYSFTFGWNLVGRSRSLKRHIKNSTVINTDSTTGCVGCLRYVNKFFYCAKFEFVTMVTIKFAELRNVTPCTLTDICWLLEKSASSIRYPEEVDNRYHRKR